MLTILIIDDNAHLQVAFKKILTTAGYKVHLAKDGEEGLRLALDTSPDVILLDMLLPKLSGLDVLRALKQDPVASHIPVIALSGLPQSNRERLMKDGAVSYLEKSLLEGAETLLQAIDYALIQSRIDEFRVESYSP